jgi:hypothetical protein
MTILATHDQIRWGTAVSLLSLDRVRPFYGPMGVPVADPDIFGALVRDVISANRDAFALEPAIVPDLRGRLLDATTRRFGPEVANSFATWVAHGFVYAPRDMLPADNWWQVLLLARRRDDRWNRLSLPPHLAAKARTRLIEARDRHSLNALDDRVSAKPLSAWDVEMYALHGYDTGDNDPFHRINLTVLKRAMLAYLRWLAAAMAQQERAALTAGAERLREELSEIAGKTPLQDLCATLSHHANDPA